MFVSLSAFFGVNSNTVLFFKPHAPNLLQRAPPFPSAPTALAPPTPSRGGRGGLDGEQLGGFDGIDGVAPQQSHLAAVFVDCVYGGYVGVGGGGGLAAAVSFLGYYVYINWR